MLRRLAICLLLTAFAAPANAAGPPPGEAIPAEALERPLLVPAGEATVATGEINAGEAVVSLPVRFGYTGRLETQMNGKGIYFQREPIPVGQPMFGVILRGRGDPQLAWCTIRPIPKSADPGRLETVCFPHDAIGLHRWVSTSFLAPLYVDLTKRPAASVPRVTPGPVDFRPMSLSYRLIEFDKKDVDIQIIVTIGQQDIPVRQIQPARREDGSAVISVLGGEIQLSPVGSNRKRATVTVLTPLNPDSEQLTLAP